MEFLKSPFISIHFDILTCILCIYIQTLVLNFDHNDYYGDGRYEEYHLKICTTMEEDIIWSLVFEFLALITLARGAPVVIRV